MIASSCEKHNALWEKTLGLGCRKSAGENLFRRNFPKSFPPKFPAPETQYEKYKHMNLRVQAHGVVQLHNTLTINAEIVEEIIMAACHEEGPLLVTSQAPCIRNSLLRSHREPHVCVAKDNAQMLTWSHNTEHTQGLFSSKYFPAKSQCKRHMHRWLFDFIVMKM